MRYAAPSKRGGFLRVGIGVGEGEEICRRGALYLRLAGDELTCKKVFAKSRLGAEF